MSIASTNTHTHTHFVIVEQGEAKIDINNIYGILFIIQYSMIIEEREKKLYQTHSLPLKVWISISSALKSFVYGSIMMKSKIFIFIVTACTYLNSTHSVYPIIFSFHHCLIRQHFCRCRRQTRSANFKVEK